MPVAIRGTGGGSVTLSSGAAATDTTLTLPNTTGTVALTASPTFTGTVTIPTLSVTGASTLTGTVTATTITSPSATALTLQYGGTTGATLDTSGNLLVGTTSAGTTTGLVVKTSASGVGGVGYFYNTHNTSGDYCAVFAMDSNTNNTSSFFLMCTNPGVANRFAIYGNGTYATASDVNLKKNIQTARDGYLDDIRSLRVVKYNWNTQADDEPKELGFIAQEVETVFPSLVQESIADGADRSYKSIKTSVIPFILVKALQELSAKNDALEARLAALEAK
jgi:hypothetical protein